MFSTPTQDGTAYVCAECALAYADAQLAKRCEAHCRATSSCSLEIGRQASGSWDRQRIT